MPSPSAQAVVALVEVIVVVVEVAHRHHSLTVVLVNLTVYAVGSYARYMSVVLLPEEFAHELNHLILYRVTLSLLCQYLHVA